MYPTLDEFICTMESALGTVLDWRTTTFWRSSAFKPAWSEFRRRSRQALPREEAVLASINQDR